MRKLGLFPCLLLVAAAPPQNPPSAPDARLREIVAPVSGAQMKRTVEKLVSFGTRHTISSQTDPKRGIGAALNWTEGRFKSKSDAVERGRDLAMREESASLRVGLTDGSIQSETVFGKDPSILEGAFTGAANR